MEPERLAELVDRHAAALELYAAQWSDAPADIVQEAFLRLAQQADAPRQPAAWLHRVVRNLAVSTVRSAQRRQRREAEAARQGPQWFLPAPGAALDAEAATQALGELPIEQREVVVAHIWGGLSFEQIAAVADISSSTVHRRYQAGLRALRERLGVSWNAKSTKNVSTTN